MTYFQAVANEAQEAIQRVRELHRPDPKANGYCDECQTNYPCPTIQTLDGDNNV